MNHLDLFSGIGGFSLAAKWSGFQTIQFVEIDKFCQKVLEKNFPNIPIHDDIKTFHFKDKVDLLTGGFPCQPFSQAGKKKGKKDERYLWPQMFRVIRESLPSWIIIENVYGILSVGIEAIWKDLNETNYSFWTYCVPAAAAYAPHRRDRIFIIANTNTFRSDHRIDNQLERFLFQDWDRYMEKKKQEWSQFIPDAWTTYTAGDWLHYNFKFGRANDGLSDRFYKDRIAAIGNAIVPQVVYPIMKFIYDIENEICHA